MRYCARVVYLRRLERIATMAGADAKGGYIFKLKPKGRAFKGLQLGQLAIKHLLQSDIISTAMPTMNSIDEVRETFRPRKAAR